jgi:hypothetical protein
MREIRYEFMLIVARCMHAATIGCLNTPSSLVAGSASSCERKSADHCNSDSIIGMSRTSEWIPPNVSRGKGPGSEWIGQSLLPRL